MISPAASPFGLLLRRLRTAAGLTQDELAERSRVSREAISVLERAGGRVPRRDTVELLAGALGLDYAARAHFHASAHAGRYLPSCRRGAPAPPCALIQPPLAGRAGELARLAYHLAGAGPPLLLLSGEPGIGKSRLLREAMEMATAAGWVVLRGGCMRRSGQEPYAPFPAALSDHLHGLPRHRLRAALDGCAWLVRLLPELADARLVPAPGWVLAPAQERRLLFAAAARFLANAAGPAGTLLVLDDLHWAGTEALDLLAGLVRDPASPVRVLGAYRDTEVEPRHSLSALLADLGCAGRAEQVELGPLPPNEAARLVDGLVAGEEHPAASRQRLLERAGGVPFFLVSGARALAATGGEAESVPEDVAQSIRQRVALLPEAAGELLQIAAMAGGRVEHATMLALAARLGQEPAVTRHALDAALHARLLAEDGETGYRLAHDLVRETVAADLSAARRRFLHGHFAAALEEGPPEAGCSPSSALA